MDACCSVRALTGFKADRGRCEDSEVHEALQAGFCCLAMPVEHGILALLERLPEQACACLPHSMLQDILANSCLARVVELQRLAPVLQHTPSMRYHLHLMQQAWGIQACIVHCELQQISGRLKGCHVPLGRPSILQGHLSDTQTPRRRALVRPHAQVPRGWPPAH